MTSINNIDTEFFEHARTYFGDVVTYDPELGGLVLYDASGSTVLLNPIQDGRRNDPSLRENLHKRTAGALEQFEKLQSSVTDFSKRLSTLSTRSGRRLDVVNMPVSTMKQLHQTELERRGTTATEASIAINRREALFRLIQRERAGSQGANNAAVNAGGLIISFADSDVTSRFLQDSASSGPSTSGSRDSGASTVGRPSFVSSQGPQAPHPLDATDRETAQLLQDMGPEINAIVHLF